MTISLDEINRITIRTILPATLRALYDWMGIPYAPGWPDNLPDEELVKYARMLGEVYKNTETSED